MQDRLDLPVVEVNHDLLEIESHLAELLDERTKDLKFSLSSIVGAIERSGTEGYFVSHGHVGIRPQIKVLALDLAWLSPDRIRLQSLFADTLDFHKEEVSVSWLQDRIEWLKAQPGSIVEQALEIFQLQEERSKEATAGLFTPVVTELIVERFENELDKNARSELLRLVFLFANAHANIFDNSTAPRKVLGLIGNGKNLDQRRYQDLFGDRTKKSTGKVKERRGPFNVLRPLDLEGKGADRFFLHPGSTITEEDHDAIITYLLSVDPTFSSDLPYKVKPAKK